MKQILLMIAVVTVVGCGKKPAEESVFDQGRPDITKPSNLPAKTEAQIEAEAKTFAGTKVKAEAGDAEAQTNLGVMYDEGQGVEQSFKDAVKWYRKAADQGDADAQSNLGLMYYKGQGVEQDFKEAFKWYQKTADQGEAKAQSNLGVMYRDGLGVDQDFKEAVKWYQKASDQGDAKAQNNLGSVYYSGEGVEKDLVIAYAWFTIAAAKGNELAINNKADQADVMTPEQITETEALVKEMTSKNPKLIQYEE